MLRNVPVHRAEPSVCPRRLRLSHPGVLRVRVPSPHCLALPQDAGRVFNPCHLPWTPCTAPGRRRRSARSSERATATLDGVSQPALAVPPTGHGRFRRRKWTPDWTSDRCDRRAPRGWHGDSWPQRPGAHGAQACDAAGSEGGELGGWRAPRPRRRRRAERGSPHAACGSAPRFTTELAVILKPPHAKTFCYLQLSASRPLSEGVRRGAPHHLVP